MFNTFSWSPYGYLHIRAFETTYEDAVNIARSDANSSEFGYEKAIERNDAWYRVGSYGNEHCVAWVEPSGKTAIEFYASTRFFKNRFTEEQEQRLVSYGAKLSENR